MTSLRDRMRQAFGRQPVSGGQESDPDDEPGPFLSADPTPARPAPVPSRSTSSKAGARSGKAPKSKKPPEDDEPLTREENDLLITALLEFSEMIDQGLWHLGFDTDTTMTAKDGNGTGVPIWTLERDEAETLATAILKRGERAPQIFVAARTVIAAYNDVQAGIILGSRFFATVMLFFQQGINVRLSRREYAMQKQEAQA